ALLILAGLMLAAGVLTKIIPAGTYDRIADSAGLLQPVPGSYRPTARPDYPLWRLFTAPFEVLSGEDAPVAIVIGIFILIVSGAFGVLGKSGVLEASVQALAGRFRSHRYLFLALVCFFFMLTGSFMGVFEEVVPLVPLAIALALSFGWDVFTGMAMSILAVGFGFSAAVANPFTVGTAQRLAGLQPLSGSLFRLLTFAVFYLVYLLYILQHVRRLERSRPVGQLSATESASLFQIPVDPGVPAAAARPERFVPRPAGQRFFAWSGAVLAVLVVASAVTRIGSDFVLPLIALGFLVIGLGSGLFAGLGLSRTLKSFGQGALGVSPAVLLILMALSVKGIIMAGGVMDTILFRAAGLLQGSGPYTAVLLMFGLTLLMNFFIGSASAKAFLLIPLLAPLASLSGLTPQIAVQAFVFGDGFTNMLYPTNAVLLVALGLSGMSWTGWLRRTWKLHLLVLTLSVLFLLLAVALGYR
ncbi:MAG: AbgT family transporter, partial [Spirochaetes bacterium]|nr:AbgT family transporter [Spirochaetota bacterium]MBU0955415.1 AbgT family transporter [Spirochaetota bacterium]